MGGTENVRPENAGPENAGPNCRGGKCRTACEYGEPLMLDTMNRQERRLVRQRGVHTDAVPACRMTQVHDDSGDESDRDDSVADTDADTGNAAPARLVRHVRQM